MWREYTTVTRLKHSKAKMHELAFIAHLSHQSFGVFNMKKSLVALATMSVVSSAFADIDISGGVKMYGVLDQAITTQTLVNNGATTIYQGMYASSATSRLGFKGSRDLGNGLKGEFQIEQEISPDQSTTMPAKNRGTFLGLSGKGGTLRLGTQETTAYETFNFDVNGRVEYKPQVWRYTTSSSTQDRANNAFKYISPEFGGVSLHGMMNYSETVSTATGSAVYTSIGAKFQNADKKLKLNVVRDQLTATTGAIILPGALNVSIGSASTGTTTTYATYATTTSTTQSSNPLVRTIGAASYDFEKVYLSVISATSQMSGIGKLSTNTFGIRVPYDNFKFALSYGTGKIESTSTTAVDGTTVNDTTFGTYYNFDKSTSAYFLYSNSQFSYLDRSTVVSAFGLNYRF